MASDTGDQIMSERERKALRAARGIDGDQQIIIMRDSKGSGSDQFGKLKDVVFVAIVLGMGSATWVQSINNAKLETTVDALKAAVADLTQEVKTLQARIKP